MSRLSDEDRSARVWLLGHVRDFIGPRGFRIFDAVEACCIETKLPRPVVEAAARLVAKVARDALARATR